MIAAERSYRHIGRTAIWRPNRSDETGFEVTINDAVLSASSELLVLVSPSSGGGGTWVLAMNS